MEAVTSNHQKAVIMGATSGIGLEVARQLYQAGWQIAIAGRRKDRLETIQKELGERCIIKVIDVVMEEASKKLMELVEELGGMDLYFHSSGIGFQNSDLEKWKEVDTVQTNALGFVRMIDTAFNYFSNNEGGKIAAITSIAGIRGLGAAPAYSATKSMQSTYLEALTQLSKMRNLGISITDVKPGFVDTELIKGGKYPMKMDASFVAKEILWAIRHKRRTLIVDWKYRILVFFWKLIPDTIWVRMRVR